MSFLYETHLHCSQASLCAASTSQELVLAYKHAGYAGFVLTDHFIFGNTSVDRSLPWGQRMACYYQAYLDAKTVADPLDFDVIFGIEHAYGAGKELLLYGVELDFLLANPDIPTITVDKLVERVHRAGGIAIQAHPYRDRSYIDMSVAPRTDIVDGIEIYNAGNLPGENLQALELVRGTDFILTSGGDIHSCESPLIGAAGVALDRRVSSSREFAEALRERKHRLMVGGRVVECGEVCEGDLSPGDDN